MHSTAHVAMRKVIFLYDKSSVPKSRQYKFSCRFLCSQLGRWCIKQGFPQHTINFGPQVVMMKPSFIYCHHGCQNVILFNTFFEQMLTAVYLLLLLLMCSETWTRENTFLYKFILLCSIQLAVLLVIFTELTLSNYIL